MTSSQFHALAEMEPEELKRIGLQAYKAVTTQVEEYAAITDTNAGRDLIEVNVKNAELYFHVLSEDRIPRPNELVDLETAARRRLGYALPLDAMLRAYRVGTQVLWKELTRHALKLNLARLGELTLEYEHITMAAAERAYVDEREARFASRQEAGRLFLARLLSRTTIEEQAVEEEARLLGYDLTQSHVAMIVAGSGNDAHQTVEDLDIEKAGRVLGGWFPYSPSTLTPSGFVFAVPAASELVAERALTNLLNRLEATGRSYRGSLGLALTGANGLLSSARQAHRALDLGAILNPGHRINRYDELRLFDLFKQGEPIDAFVRDVLGPLLDYDAANRTRMVETLRGYFESGMNRKAAARRVGIHANTLDYRLRQIEEVLGTKIMAPTFTFRGWLAIKLLPLAEGLPQASRGPTGD
jgi:sugar diacid utilization regulator